MNEFISLNKSLIPQDVTEKDNQKKSQSDLLGTWMQEKISKDRRCAKIKSVKESNRDKRPKMFPWSNLAVAVEEPSDVSMGSKSILSIG